MATAETTRRGPEFPKTDPSRHLWIVDRFTEEPVPESIKEIITGVEECFRSGGYAWKVDRFWAEAQYLNLRGYSFRPKPHQPIKDLFEKGVTPDSPDRLQLRLRVDSRDNPPYMRDLLGRKKGIDLDRITNCQIEKTARQIPVYKVSYPGDLGVFSNSKRDASSPDNTYGIYYIEEVLVCQNPQGIWLEASDALAGAHSDYAVFVEVRLINILVDLLIEETNAKDKRERIERKYFKKTED
jgi:hypothetical protein